MPSDGGSRTARPGGCGCRVVRVRRPPEVLEIDGNGSSMLVGILRPAVVFPTATLARLSRPERAMVIGHELAHARRGDLLWGW